MIETVLHSNLSMLYCNIFWAASPTYVLNCTFLEARIISVSLADHPPTFLVPVPHDCLLLCLLRPLRHRSLKRPCHSQLLFYLADLRLCYTYQ